MKIITKRGAKKIAHDMTIIIKNSFKSKGINLKEKEIIKIENDFLKTLGGRNKWKKELILQ